MNFTLATPSWDDQGLWFALVFNTIVATCLFGASTFLLLTPLLWVRRLYRTNHTILSLGAPQTQDPSTHSSPVKRIGKVLRYRCSLFSIPSWRDWLSVEENVPHLESIFRSSEQTTCVDENANPVQVSPETNPCALSGAGADVPASSGPIVPSASQWRRGINSTKTPLDPQVALYLGFLKLSASIFVIGTFFIIWTCVLSGTDDYMEKYMVQRDIYQCHSQGDNETRCIAKAPHCQYVMDIGCFPVPLRGLYDLSTQNITPHSWRLWLVGIFDMCFCFVYTVCILFFLRRVDTYISGVMRLQMERSIGHRVVLIRGLRKEETLSPKAFKDRFLSESAYFLPRRHYGSDAVAYNRVGDNDDDDDDNVVYHHYDCTGINCLFSAVRCSCYMTTRANAVFTQESQLKQLLFPRKAPRGMYSCMSKTENALKALEEALADHKANLLRLEEERSSGKTRHGSEGDGTVLMMRKPFPSCCSKVPKVEYCKQAFVEHAVQLNKSIEEVSHNHSKGSAFIVFRSPLAAYEFVNLLESQNGITSNRRATLAGLPGQIVQVNIAANRYMVWGRSLVVCVAFVLLVFFWSIPVGFLGSLDNIARVPGIGESFAKYYKRVPETLRGILTAYLPVVVLAIFNIMLPIIMRFFAIAMGAINKTECDGGILYLQYLFMVLTEVIFQAALQGGLSQLGDLITDASADSIINFFVAVVSPGGGYWYAKILTEACVSVWIELIDPVPLIMAILRKKMASVQRVYDGLFQPCVFEWSQRYCFDLTIIAMGLLFRMTAPLLVLFVGLFFTVRYMTQRCRLYDRYRPNTLPENDCTNFAAPVQVIRAVSWLFCLGSTGGVLLMSLRGHIGGVVCCSVTLASGILLLVYVHLVTRRWIASLAHARTFFGNRATSTTLYGTGSEAAREAKNGSCQSGVGALEESLLDVGQICNTNMDPRLSPVAPTVDVLPQMDCAGSLYQPKHQRLLRIDAAQEIERLERSVFHVDRYWEGPFEMVERNSIYDRTAEEVPGV